MLTLLISSATAGLAAADEISNQAQVSTQSSAIAAARSELKELQQQLELMEKNCGVCQQSQTQLATSNTRLFVVQRRQTWVPASQAASFGVAGTVASSQTAFQSFSSPTFVSPAFVSSGMGVSNAPFGFAPAAQSFATCGNANASSLSSFSQVGTSVLPASPGVRHSSYDIYSQGAFAHSASRFGAAAVARPVYQTEHFRGVSGFISTNAVPNYAVY